MTGHGQSLLTVDVEGPALLHLLLRRQGESRLQVLPEELLGQRCHLLLLIAADFRPLFHLEGCQTIGIDTDPLHLLPHLPTLSILRNLGLLIRGHHGGITQPAVHGIRQGYGVRMLHQILGHVLRHTPRQGIVHRRVIRRNNNTRSARRIIGAARCNGFDRPAFLRRESAMGLQKVHHIHGTHRTALHLPSPIGHETRLHHGERVEDGIKICRVLLRAALLLLQDGGDTIAASVTAHRSVQTLREHPGHPAGRASEPLPPQLLDSQGAELVEVREGLRAHRIRALRAQIATEHEGGIPDDIVHRTLCRGMPRGVGAIRSPGPPSCHAVRPHGRLRLATGQGRIAGKTDRVGLRLRRNSKRRTAEVALRELRKGLRR